MRIVNVKIVTKIVISFFVILIMSMTTSGFLLYIIRNTGNIASELYDIFNITINTFEAKKEVSTLINNLDILQVALENRDQDMSSSTYFKRVSPNINKVKEHVEKLKKENTKDEWDKYITDEKIMSEEIRCFLAFDIEDNEVLRKLINVQQLLVNSNSSLKIIKPENIHITLNFLGNISKSKSSILLISLFSIGIYNLL